MALTESTQVSIAAIEPNGVIFVKKATQIYRDGEPVGSPAIWRGPLVPGADLAGQDPLVVSVATAVWTPEVIAAYRAAQEAARRTWGG